MKNKVCKCLFFNLLSRITNYVPKVFVSFEDKILRELTKTRLIEAVDSNWIIQINDLEFSKYSAGLYSYAGTGVREKYAKLAYETFEKTIIYIRLDFIKSLFHIPLPHEMRTTQQKSKISGEVLELIA